MELKIARNADKDQWDTIVENSPNGTLFHTWKWLHLIEKYSSMKNVGIKSFIFSQNVNAQLFAMILMDKNSPVGVFPFYFFENPICSFCYSPPHSDMGSTPYLGPLFPYIETMTEEKKQTLLIDVQKVMDQFFKKNLKSKYVLINTPPGYSDSRSFRWGGYTVDPRFTYYIDLTQGPDSIWKNFNRSLKYYIEKARKVGITVFDGNKEEALYIYDLLNQRGRTTFPKAFLGELFDNFFPNNMKIFIARTDSEYLSGIITISYKDKVSFWIGAPRCSYKGLSPNELVLWESIRWASEHGYKTYEIIGADDFSLFPFKRKFNGKVTPYYQMKWSSPIIRVLSSLYYTLKKGNNNQLGE